MFKPFVLLLLLFFFSNSYFAQEKSVEQELEQQAEKIDYVPDVRIFLIDRLEVSDRKMVRKLQNYLLEGEDSVTRNLYLQEKILLQYWLGQFYSLPELIAYPDPIDLQQSDSSILLPPNDSLFSVLFKKVNSQAPYLKLIIEQNDSLQNEDKDFLILSLDYFRGEAAVPQDTLNQKVISFLEMYPESEYRNLIVDNYYKKYKASNFGFDFSLFTGYHVNSADVATLFDNGFAIGLGVGFAHKDWLLQLSIHSGISRAKRDIYINGTWWEYDHGANIFQFESSLGHIINSNKRLSLIPIVGIGTTSISPFIPNEEDEEYYQGVAFKAKFTTYAGIGLRFKVPKKLKESAFGPYTTGFTYLKLQYRYSRPQLDAGYSGLGGEMHLISIGFGGFIHDLKSVKDF